ncbi:BTB/POZ domain-containing protein [Canna indica]|uniref:BTB/POZ domain-containing protein n=1 Tax=Canna indica TaxID=4628 RepID=A0AAQ3JV16_9LILI|nr:BTB/POZ domain-containing protein [Canna indica]
MPPFASAGPAFSYSPPPGEPSNSVVTLNVGGQIFQTTSQTLALAGPDSLLSSFASSPPSSVPFIDRDPELFSVLLSLLRTGRLSSRATAAFDPDDLLAEARFYSLHLLLLSLLAHPSLFDAFALRRSRLLPLPGRDPPSALAPSSVADADVSLIVAHGGKVSSFDPSLRRRSTILTPLPAVDSLLALGPLLAAGATDLPGLHLLDLRHSGGPVRHVLHWSPHPSATAAAVQAVGSSSDLLFCSFESCRRNASAILAFDRTTLEPVTEIARREIYGAELDSAIPATKLQWVPEFNLLMAAGSHSGPSGLSGDIRLWDVRSSEAIWDLKEKVDCFADITVSDSLSAMFKVGINSGEVFMADIRKLSSEKPWTCIGGGSNLGNGKKEGSGSRIESYGRHVFCSKGGDVEMWTEVLMGVVPSTRIEDGLQGERVMKRNFMGGLQASEEKKINLLGFGGNRMVVARKDDQCVEVWESSVRS